jgi:hypothetical protein
MESWSSRNTAAEVRRLRRPLAARAARSPGRPESITIISTDLAYFAPKRESGEVDAFRTRTDPDVA